MSCCKPRRASRSARLRSIPPTPSGLRGCATSGIAGADRSRFGVSTAEHARAAVALGADGVVVGSAALRAALQGPAALAGLLKALRRGLDG